MATIKGIDISHHQRPPNWEQVAADGVKFCICRATYGTRPDATFADYFNGARNAGIIPGAYHFLRFSSQATTAQTAEAQAAAFVAEVRSVTSNPAVESPLLIALDLEDNVANGDRKVDKGVASDQYMRLARSWLAIVEEQLDRQCIIYTGPSFWTDHVGGADLLPRPLWIAHYTSKPAPKVPPPWTDWAIWQFTGTGRVPGFVGDIDINRFQGTMDGLKALAFKRAPVTPPVVPPGAGPELIANATAEVQRALNKYAAPLGFTRLVVDGIAGVRTRAALALALGS